MNHESSKKETIHQTEAVSPETRNPESSGITFKQQKEKIAPECDMIKKRMD